jgi:hypothetical protein
MDDLKTFAEALIRQAMRDTQEELDAARKSGDKTEEEVLLAIVDIQKKEMEEIKAGRVPHGYRKMFGD